MRSINQIITKQKDKEHNTPIELYQIFLEEITLYMAMWPVDIDFYDEDGNPRTYKAAAIQRGQINRDIDSKIDKVRVQIGNVNREMSSYVANTDIRGKRLKIIKVFRDADQEIKTALFGGSEFTQTVENYPGAGLLNQENHIELFEGNIDSPTLNEKTLTVEVTSKLDKLSRRLPKRNFQVQCNWFFGDSETCGVQVPTLSGSIDSLSTENNIIYDSDITEEDNYWKHGSVKVGQERRIVVESGNGYIKLEYPIFNISDGDYYDLKAGCDKSYDSGHGCTFWENTEFYGGFLNVPKMSDNVRRYG